MKVGTRIFIKETGYGCKGAEGSIGVVTDKEAPNGLLSLHNGYNVELENGNVWRINPDAKVDVLEPVFGKHLLRDGVVVKRRNDTYAIVIGDYLYSKMGHTLLSDYDDDLINQIAYTKDLDIMAICKPIGKGSIIDIFNGILLGLIAERPEEVKEMTLAEVCKELGYNVKIVKEV